MMNQTKQIEVALKDLLPNPHRRIEHYPIIREKVAALVQSYQQTGYWGNIVVRPSPTKPGKYEKAYGHHRYIALKETMKPTDKVAVIVNDKLTEEYMVKMMASENMDQWNSSALVDLETIYATVMAFAQGKIELNPLPEKTKNAYIRYAPSFIPGRCAAISATHPYTVESIASFLGWLQPTGTPQRKVYTVFTALQFIEEGLLKEQEFAGLTSNEAATIVGQANQRKKAQEEAAERAVEEAEQARRVAEYQAEEARKAKDAAKKEEHERERARAEIDRDRAEKEAISHKAKAKEEFVKATRHGAEHVRSGAHNVRLEMEVAYTPDLDPEPLKKPEAMNMVAFRLIKDLADILSEKDVRFRKLDEIIEEREYLEQSVRKHLVDALFDLSKRSEKLATLLCQPTPQNGQVRSRAKLK